MKIAAIVFALCTVFFRTATAETLSNVSSWRDVSNFLKRHDVSEAAAILYIGAGCDGLPTISQGACLRDALSDPKSYEGLSTEWVAKVEARVAEEAARLAAELERREKEQQQELAAQMQARADQERKADIEFLERTIREQERTRREIEMTADRLGDGNLTATDQDQLETVLRRYDEDIANMRKRLLQIRMGENTD